ncbi:MAG: hypothetical protein GF403_04240 [Candidatus Coatesbacteria bacterium]|nr:hypothetical protein [Candidatus Coatesbacteria bacterium]
MKTFPLLHQRAISLGIAALVLLFTVTPTAAMYVVGSITDAATGKPVPGAVVSLGQTAASSEANGEFRLQFDVGGLLRIEAGERFPALAVPLARTSRLELPLIPARIKLGEREVSLLDFFRDAARRNAESPDSRWRHAWGGPVEMYLDPDLSPAQSAALERHFTAPDFPELGLLEPLKPTDDELRARLYVRPGGSEPRLSLTYDAATGRPLGGVLELGGLEDGPELRRFLQRSLLRLFGLHPLEADDPRGGMSVLGAADGFTRLDALALAVALRLPYGTDLGWYGPRRALDIDSRRFQVLALPFAVTYEDPYMSNIAATTVAQVFGDFGPFFHLRLHPDILELGRLAVEERSPGSKLVRDEPFTLEEAVAAARERGCRYVFWGRLVNRGESARAAFYAADAVEGRLIVSREDELLLSRLHFPRFLARSGLELARAVAGPAEVPSGAGTLQLHFTSVHASIYVHVLVDERLVAVLYPNDGSAKLPLAPGRHRVLFRYFLPMRHEGCVAGVFAGEKLYTVEIESGRESSIATLFDLNPTQSGRNWNYSKTRIFNSAGELVSEEYHDLATEREMWRSLFDLVEKSRRTEGFLQD